MIYKTDCKFIFIIQGGILMFWFDSINLRKLEKKYIYGFFTTIIIGFITHMYFITNFLPNSDTNMYPSAYGESRYWQIQIGRWFSVVPFDKLSSYYMLPWIIGVITILIYSIVSVLIIYCYDIKNKITVIIVSSFIISSPTIMAMFGFINYSDVFAWGFLLSVLSICILKKSRTIKGLSISSLILACAIGMYQSYLCVAIVLCIILMIQDFFSDDSGKILLKKVIKYILYGIIGVILYFVIWKAFLLIYKLQPADYKGMTDMSYYSLSNILENIIESYNFFILSFFSNNLYYNPFYKIICYVALTLIVLILLIYHLFKTKGVDIVRKIFLLLLILIVLPIGLGSIKILAPQSNVSPLTIINMSLYIPIIFLLIYELIPENNISKIVQKYYYICIICAGVILYNNILICNVGYLNFKLQNIKASYMLGNIMNRVLNTEGYSYDSQLFISGDIKGSNYKTVIPQYHEYLKGMELADSDVSVYDTMFAKEAFIRTYFGIYISYPSDEIQKEILNSVEYKELKVWPNKDCIGWVNGVLVVRME
jgi:hypothetical protein